MKEEPITEFTTVIPFWKPRVTPVDLNEATEEQLEAMKVTPSDTGVGEYVLVLAHDPPNVARADAFVQRNYVQPWRAGPGRNGVGRGCSLNGKSVYLLRGSPFKPIQPVDQRQNRDRKHLRGRRGCGIGPAPPSDFQLCH